MIGAMPAVYVRHERRKKKDKKKSRPHINLSFHPKKLPPSHGNSPSHSRAGSVTPSPTHSPHQSFPENEEDEGLQELYVCGRVTLLHLVVISLLLGGIILIVGLVQFKPGADANANRYYIIGAGAFLLVIGFILIILRCCVIPWQMRRLQQLRKEDSGMSAVAIGINNDAAKEKTNETNDKTDLNGQPYQKESDGTVLDGTTVQTDNNPSVSIEMATSLESHETLPSMKSPSEHDALIKKSTSNLGTSST